MTFVTDKSGNNPKDLPWDHFNRSGGGAPAAVVPMYAGERYLDSTAGVVYQAMSPLANSWQVVTNVRR
jgi:hypothetical protein